MGVKQIIFTDIATDGMLSGPSFEQLAELQGAVGCRIVASGGVTTLAGGNCAAPRPGPRPDPPCGPIWPRRRRRPSPSPAARYGPLVTAAVGRDGVYGCQFHPEKSGETGLQILKNFGAFIS